MYRADEDRKRRPTAASCSWSSFGCNLGKSCSGNGTLWTIWARFFLFFLPPSENRRFSRFITITNERDMRDCGRRVSRLNLNQIWTSTFNIWHVIRSIEIGSTAAILITPASEDHTFEYTSISRLV